MQSDLTEKEMWQSYRDLFPQKYWGAGFFEATVPVILQDLNLSEKRILDLAAGARGTECLHFLAKNNELCFLDPFIEEPPSVYNRILSWNDVADTSFDLIVCRGAINYMFRNELYLLSRSLKKSGLFVFNTFLSKPSLDWTEKQYKIENGAFQSNNCIERSRLINNIVEHELTLIEHNVKIKHTFNYYNLSDYLEMTKLHLKQASDLNLENNPLFYKSNSSIIVLEK